jgi:RNA polymerase sigma-70 factor (sigma-E family)
LNAEHERDYTAYVTARLQSLRRMAAQLAGDPHRGDDLVQQAITKLYLSWRRASQARNLDAYVHRILVRVFLDERRGRWATVRLDADLTGPAGAGPVTDPDNRLVLHAALGHLPPRQRAVVVLRFLADHPVDEVADMLRISPGTVKSQTSDGLAKLRALLRTEARPTHP